jgi:hypothetical protein
MHRKVNERQKVYYFAFINLELYPTKTGNCFIQNLNLFGNTKIVYDPDAGYYWEVKKHIDKTQRPSPVSEDINKEMIPAFTEKDRFDLVKEYEELEREIHDDLIQRQSYNLWNTPLLQFYTL